MPSIRDAGRASVRVSIATAAMASPVGRLTLAASERGLAAVLWETDDPRRVPLGTADEAPDHPVLREAATQLGAYFAGNRRGFDLPLDFHGTAFQRRVWAELLLIPFGETRSYGGIARAHGDPNLMRGVGAAKVRNPFPSWRPAIAWSGPRGNSRGSRAGWRRRLTCSGWKGWGRGRGCSAGSSLREDGLWTGPGLRAAGLISVPVRFGWSVWESLVWLVESSGS